MIARWVGWAAMVAGILGCTTHYVRPQNDKVYLYLKRPAAEQVFLACSVDGFSLRPARRIRGELWEAVVESNKEFRYFYLVDGSVYAPACRFHEMDDWGGKNCIYVP
ncbi:MAG: hypothetical protein AMJ54_00650 [Deltaproteobacteria bacterium SG8_13]|nr:MAG: hypothetical protein AMJ54_00650 [Deltaproteobacteria bacterium SG8_13]